MVSENVLHAPLIRCTAFRRPNGIVT
jgi:hypothetical protein